MPSKKHDLGSLDVDLMLLFDAVMTEGNLTKAARRLGLAQPTVSNGLARLRSIFADELFERTGHGVRPTPRARQLAEPIRTAIGLLTVASTPNSQFSPAAIRRTFNLEMRPEIERLIAPGLIELVAANAAGARIFIRGNRNGSDGRDLRNGDPDLAIDAVLPGKENERHEQVLEDIYVVVARKGHPNINEQLTLTSYGQLNHLVLALPGAGDKSPITIALEQNGLRRQIPFAVSDTSLIPELLLSTDLVATIGRRLALQYASQHDLKIRQLPLPMPTIRYYQIWHSRYDLDPEHQWLRSQIQIVTAQI